MKLCTQFIPARLFIIEDFCMVALAISIDGWFTGQLGLRCLFIFCEFVCWVSLFVTSAEVDGLKLQFCELTPWLSRFPSSCTSVELFINGIYRFFLILLKVTS